MAAAHDNIDLEIVRPDGRTFLDDADALFRHACLPMPNADNRHWFEGILRRAAARGVRVMLGGYKGNATISYTGVRGLRRWAWTGRWRRLLREANALAQVRGRRTRAIWLRSSIECSGSRRFRCSWRAISSAAPRCG